MRAFMCFPFLILLPSSAFAHWGHVGEFAGHGHWVAVGAGMVGAALAAFLGKKSSDEVSEDDDVDGATDGELGELEGAAV